MSCRYCGRLESPGHKLLVTSLLVERPDGPYRGVRLISDRPHAELVVLCATCYRWISTCRFCRWFEATSPKGPGVSGRCLWENAPRRPGGSPYRQVREPPPEAPATWPSVKAGDRCAYWKQHKPVKGGWL